MEDGTPHSISEGFLPPTDEEERLIVLSDIMNFSMNDSLTQLYYIYLFQMYVRFFTDEGELGFESSLRFTDETAVFFQKMKLFDFGDELINITNFIPTGDGCYMIADKCSVSVALEFLTALVAGIQQVTGPDGSRGSIRVSALFGKCIPFTDIAGHKNYLGDGMNEAERILSCGKRAVEDALRDDGRDVNALSSNSLYLGDSLAAGLNESHSMRTSRVMSFKDLPDKHGRRRNVTVLQGIRMYCPYVHRSGRDWM